MLEQTFRNEAHYVHYAVLTAGTKARRATIVSFAVAKWRKVLQTKHRLKTVHSNEPQWGDQAIISQNLYSLVVCELKHHCVVLCKHLSQSVPHSSS